MKEVKYVKCIPVYFLKLFNFLIFFIVEIQFVKLQENVSWRQYDIAAWNLSSVPVLEKNLCVLTMLQNRISSYINKNNIM